MKLEKLEREPRDGEAAAKAAVAGAVEAEGRYKAAKASARSAKSALRRARKALKEAKRAAKRAERIAVEKSKKLTQARKKAKRKAAKAKRVARKNKNQKAPTSRKTAKKTSPLPAAELAKAPRPLQLVSQSPASTSDAPASPTGETQTD